MSERLTYRVWDKDGRLIASGSVPIRAKSEQGRRKAIDRELRRVMLTPDAWTGEVEIEQCPDM